MSNVMNRRAILGRLAAATAALAALPVATTAAPAPSLAALIEAHRVARQAFEDTCGPEDDAPARDSRFSNSGAEKQVLGALESATLMALCAYRPETMAEVHLRGDYLDDFNGELSFEQQDAMFASFRSTSARRAAQ